jgi:hypothetical protein
LSHDEKEALLSDSKVLLLLSDLIKNNLQELLPEIDPNYGVKYPLAEKLLERHSDEIKILIEKLVKHGILFKKFYEKIMACPNCYSINVTTHYHCPFCNSIDIEKKVLIEHVLCGNIEDKNRYERNGKLVCPKCGNELKSPNVDYRTIGSWFECNSCHKKFDIPNLIHFCRNCKRNFNVGEISLINVYSYKLNEKVRHEIEEKLIIAPIKKAFEGFNYKVEVPGTLKGSSGTLHTFNLVASKTYENETKAIALDISLSTSVVEEQSVITLFAKVFDTRPNKSILVTMPVLSEKGKKMAELYGIKILEGKNVEEIINGLKLFLSEV